MEIVLRPLTPELIDHLADQNLTADSIRLVRALVQLDISHRANHRVVGKDYVPRDEPVDFSEYEILNNLLEQNERIQAVSNGDLRLFLQDLFKKLSDVEDDNEKKAIHDQLLTVLFSDGEQDGIPAHPLKALFFVSLKCKHEGPVNADDKRKYLAVIDDVLQSEVWLETSPVMLVDAERLSYFLTKDGNKSLIVLKQLTNSDRILREHPSVVLDALERQKSILSDHAPSQAYAVVEQGKKISEGFLTNTDILETSPGVVLRAALYLLSSATDKVRREENGPNIALARQELEKVSGDFRSVVVKLLLKFGLAEEVQTPTHKRAQKKAAMIKKDREY